MVEQLQLELQQDIKTTQRILQKDQEQLSAEIARGNKKMDELDKKITELQFEMDISITATFFDALLFCFCIDIFCVIGGLSYPGCKLNPNFTF